MKAPLVLFITLFLICVFSGCGKGSYYYHNDLPCGKVNGDVKTVTDTMYVVVNGGALNLLRTSEFQFDSLHRLVDEQDCFYYTERNGMNTDSFMQSRRVVKNRYDRDGRKIEIRRCNYMYNEHGVDSTSSSQRLISLDGNNEVWEENPSHTIVSYTYEKNRVTMSLTEEDPKDNRYTVSVFDSKGNLIESNSKAGDEPVESTAYKYDENGLLIETVDSSGRITRYQYDEFDNEGNWMKRVALNEKNEPQYITRRRIAYRIQR